jgi:hypothetical protein
MWYEEKEGNAHIIFNDTTYMLQFAKYINDILE